MIHNLKILPTYFEDVTIGKKIFEIRKNDRDFQIGDSLVLHEWKGNHYTGRTIVKTVCYVTDFKQRSKYVVLGIE